MSPFTRPRQQINTFKALERRDSVVWSGMDNDNPMSSDMDSRKPSACRNPRL
jgi:hypothetical protein